MEAIFAEIAEIAKGTHLSRTTVEAKRLNGIISG